MSNVPVAVHHLVACVTAAAAAVLLLRLPLRRAFGPRIAYAVWALVPLAVIGALLPAPIASPSSVVPKTVLRESASPRFSMPPLPLADSGPVRHQLDLGQWLLVGWIVGCGILVLVQWYQQRVFIRRLGALQHGDPGEWISEIDDFGPVVVGVFSPRIILPADFRQRYTAQERALVLAHERMHLARRDPLANLVVAVVRSVFWFHPLVHLASRYFRIDQELACDAAVLEGRPQERSRYAHALLKTQFGGQELTAGCCLASRTTSSLKRRIIMLRTPAPGFRRRLLGATVVVLTGMVSGSLAWALQTPRAPQAAVLQVDSVAAGGPTAVMSDTVVAQTMPQLDTVAAQAAPRARVVYRSATPVLAADSVNNITTINADSVLTAAPLRNVTDLLNNRVPGLTVVRTTGDSTPQRRVISNDITTLSVDSLVQTQGNPGNPARLRLRGPARGLSGYDPIVIVDGIRLYATQVTSNDSTAQANAAPSPLDYLDPNIIEKIEVLKGPAAEQLYGKDAANGVIVITTKSPAGRRFQLQAQPQP